MKKLISLLTLAGLLWSSLALANDYIEGEGRFYAGDDDSLAFVKSQLISNAFQDVISKELASMGLDANLFWNKWNARFDSYFTPVQEQLREKYKLDEQGNGAQKNDYQKALRVKKLELQARYGDLARVVSSYSIKRMTRSTQVPNSRYMSLQAKVDRFF